MQQCAMVFVQTLYPLFHASAESDPDSSEGTFLNKLTDTLNVAEIVLFVIELAILDLLMVGLLKQLPYLTIN